MKIDTSLYGYTMKKFSEEIQSSCKMNATLSSGTKEGEAEEVGSEHSEQSVHSDRSQSKQSSEGQRQEEEDQKKLGRYGFRLSPDEQELAYELKASLMKQLQQQNAKITSEIEVHKRFERMKRTERAQTARKAPTDEMSRVNAVRLMKLYEKQAIKSDLRAKELEHQLEESRDLCRRYRDMYLKARGVRDGENAANDSERSEGTKSKDSAIKPNSREGSRANSKERSHRGHSKDKVTEDDLDDDEAIYKRHIAKLADTKSVKTTAPIRVTDVIRKSEVVFLENEHLKLEVQRLKWDNAQLIKKTKHANSEKDNLLHNISTSEFARRELSKRLEKEKTDHQKLQRSLTRQASEWIQLRKESQEADDNRRWTHILAVGPYESDSRAKHPVKKNVDLPRKMYPVEDYDRSKNGH